MKAISASKEKLVLGLILISIFSPARTRPYVPDDPLQARIEKYRFFTDRGVYIAGEEIRFRVFNLSPDSLKTLEWSKVYYVELISPDGNTQARSKIAMDSNSANGTLKVPDEISSGTYFIKGYTRWMRNFGPENYAYMSINIVNPKNKRVLPVDTSFKSKVLLKKSSMESSGSGPDLGNLQNRYPRRSKVHLDLHAGQNAGPVECCISVVPKGSYEDQRASVPAVKQPELNRMVHLPETKGVSLSGKVEFAQTGAPAPYAIVYISLLDKGREFYCNYADNAGNFYFAFPDQAGDKELFISASHPDPGEVILLIDQDYCKEPIQLPSYPLGLDSVNERLINQLSVNAQIMDQYAPVNQKGNAEDDQNRMFFYGDPAITVRYDDYIKLPTMEEYISEVTPQVAIRSIKRKKRLVVSGDHPDLEFYAPLLMIDGVAIFEVESALAISPRYIDRIEIVDAPYIKGNVTFGGIINILSKNNNMGFIDLPSSGLQVNYEMNEEHIPPDQPETPADPRFPDVRNTLYWNPGISLGTNESKTIDFQTGDTPGVYEVVARGYASDGSFICQSWSFKVD